MRQSPHFVRMLGALALGCFVAFLPRMTSNLPESGILGSLKLGITWLGAPGLILNLVIAGNVHFVTLWIIDLVNVVVYSGLVYCLLRRRSKHKRES
jgi:hypothetical protein